MKKYLHRTVFGSFLILAGLSAEKIDSDIPTTAQLGSLALANLKLNRQGNVIAVYPEEKVRALVNIACDVAGMNPHALYQVVIGYENEEPQTCIVNEFGFRYEDSMIIPFFLKAPKSPGVYNIQFRLEQTSSPVLAMKNWGSELSSQMTIGKLIVLE